ncbi:MAG: hypothetical protein KDD43_01925 [Bdellovibrionales bacterium]|nr:hypothetical protein [Bdellovibrionales bacterium]
MKAGILVILAALIQAPLALGLATKSCPKKISVEFGQPTIEKWYAEKAYDDFFSGGNTVSGELELKNIYSSQCSYSAVDGSGPVYSAVLKGTFSEGSSNPAKLVVYMSLPIRGLTENDIGSAVIYSPLQKVSTQGIQLKGASEIYYESEMCSWGDCIPDHVYLGVFGLAKAQ